MMILHSAKERANMARQRDGNNNITIMINKFQECMITFNTDQNENIAPVERRKRKSQPHTERER